MTSENDKANPPPKQTFIDASTLYLGDCRPILRSLPAESIHCCVTSPPYFGLRDYNHAQQIGLEQTPDAFVAELVAVFREVRRVLKPDGTLWLNMGDTYAASGRGGGGASFQNDDIGKKISATNNRRAPVHGLKQKDLIGVPWMLAFALRSDGWYLRQDIIWHKPNPMPESVRDRCTKSHEYIFLLAKNERYYFDAEAIKTPSKDPTDDARRIKQQASFHKSSPTSERNGLRPRHPFGGVKYGESLDDAHRTKSGNEYEPTGTANRRTVWSITTKPFKGAHFATFPPDLIEPCILAGCPVGGTVLDPFFGAGTTGLVAAKKGRRAIGIELNQQYFEMACARLRGEEPPRSRSEAIAADIPTTPPSSR